MILSQRFAVVYVAAVAGLLVVPSGSLPGLPGTGRATLRAAGAAQDRSADDQGARVSRTIKVGRNSSLTVSNLSGDISVTGGRGSQIRVEAVKRSGRGLASGTRLEDVRVDVAEHGDRVEVRTLYRGGNTHVSVDYTITVPADAAVYVRSVSGDVKVAQVQGETRAESVSGDVSVTGVSHLDKASSVSGNVTLTNAASEGDLSTGSVSGNVTIHGLKAGGLDLSSVSGDLNVSGLTCPRVSARTVSGTFSLEGPLARNGRYEISSHSGDIRLRLAGNTGFELNASSFSGDIDTDYPITMRDTGSESGRRSRHAIRGTFGDASALLSIRTFSGSISLRRQ